MVDLGPLYPTAIKPDVVTEIRKYYVKTYKDQFFTAPPAWFNGYILMEAVYHLPFSFYAIFSLLQGTL